ncbi:5'-3' DNA helicase ZGRF1-like [Tubulanus polymorphus]|uniref:5'-3' DNA helicase ZGRF1-like n=1 Tax=Tubulanus polymorphus TaxID=672921 RepID=UPI003DA39AE9
MSYLNESKRNSCNDLVFPSRTEVEAQIEPLIRRISIPVTYTSVAAYKQVFIAALKEHLNIVLFDLAKSYHSALMKVDVTKYIGCSSTIRPGQRSDESSNPLCDHKLPSKLVQVKKDGSNKGRFFYACSGQRNDQCKFFKWTDQVSIKSSSSTSGKNQSRLEITDGNSLTTYLRGHGIVFYPECRFLKKAANFFKQKNCPPWAKKSQNMEQMSGKNRLYIKLSRKDSSKCYSKDDLWIVAQNLNFEMGLTFLAKSVFYGPSNSNEVEIEPISGFSPSNWPGESDCHAILARNATSELTCIANIEDHVQTNKPPIIRHLINRNESVELTSTHSLFKAPSIEDAIQQQKVYIPPHLLEEETELFISRYHLNEDQAEALRRSGNLFNTQQDKCDSILHIHGVFGAGKSYLLAVMIVYMVRIFELSDVHTPGVPFKWKVLVSSTTNVAVDRILTGLLALDFEAFVRVGSVRKIAKSILPYSVHATGTDNQELKDLQEMLKGSLTPSDRVSVRKSIERHKRGENKKLLHSVRVVGATCAACPFSCLNNMEFPVVLLDECSQITEPASLLPIARFSCHKIVLVGDPKQLGPTLQGSEAAHEEGLEQTLFDRTLKMGYNSVLLRTQYRCHPIISAVANDLFYQHQLKDGIQTSDRLPLLVDLPVLCFYNVHDGHEMCDRDGSFYNDAEIDFVVFFIQYLSMNGIEPNRIGVITLYKAQMFKIQQQLLSDSGDLRSIQVSTVDAFQGGERDIIILSCVRSHAVGFIDSDKRTNVALTRAKHHLLIIGNMKNLKTNALWGRVIQHCQKSPGGIQNSKTLTCRYRTTVNERKERNKESQHESHHCKKRKPDPLSELANNEILLPATEPSTESKAVEENGHTELSQSNDSLILNSIIRSQPHSDSSGAMSLSQSSNCELVSKRTKRQFRINASVFDEEQAVELESEDDNDLTEFKL